MEDSKGGRQNTRVFLENLPDGVRKDEIGKEFYNFGDIAKIYLMYSEMGSGFVEFFDGEDAAFAAEQMNGANFRGNRLKTRLTSGGVARGRGYYPSSRSRGGRGFSSNYGDRSDRFDSSDQGYGGDSGYQNRRGGFPRRGRGGRDRFDNRDSGRSRSDRNWDYEDNDRDQGFGERRFSSNRNDRNGFSGRGRRDFSERDYDDMPPRRSSYNRNEYTPRGRGDYSQSFRRSGGRGQSFSSRQYDESPPFKKSYGRNAEENDIIVGIKPTKYMKRDYDTYEDDFEGQSFRKAKRSKEMMDSDDDFRNLRDRSPVPRERKEHYTTSSYDQKASMSYVTEDGTHRSHRPKHTEKPREEKDFVSSHRRHRSREEQDRY